MCEFFCRIQSLWHVWRRLKPNLPTRNTKESHAMSTLRCIFLLCNYVVKAWHRMLKRGISFDLQELNRSGTLAEVGLQGWSTFIAQEWQFGGLLCLDCFELREHNLFVQCDQSKQCWWQYSTSWLRWLQHLPVPTWEVSTCSWTQQR